MIKEIIVVEGKDDTTAIRRAVKAETIETGGSALSEEVIERIRLAQARRGVIIFTDPDFAGDRIRKIISQKVPGCKHAFIDVEAATYKDDIGVENASDEDIRRALQLVKTEAPPEEGEIEWNDLLDAGLIVHPQAAERRRLLGKALHIGYCNGKQLYKRCRMFAISKEEFRTALVAMEQAFARGHAVEEAEQSP
ncbi:ribonuclease M5 [Xylanibacillus composti]|uniref:Ribonuclease M5 n=1 Tax=Xylanibacillus composti TaxID=1572762 RepID=A0A8J4M0X8_9BACL|nr:ribonuclease M5 [Xylanibacillus composti]MDT9725160.1 ribonuclease M5 [Xylanibacillus composti]GIQ67267.1 ribonuclease M5 [Xylanibacillus composti]